MIPFADLDVVLRLNFVLAFRINLLRADNISVGIVLVEGQDDPDLGPVQQRGDTLYIIYVFTPEHPLSMESQHCLSE